MSAKPSDSLHHYLYLLDRDRKAVRAEFKERFGAAAEDGRFEEQLLELLSDANINDSSIVASDLIGVPVELLLAFILRPHGKGRRRPPKERWARRQADLMVRSASKRWAELVDVDGQPAKPAREQAAIEKFNEAEASGNFRYARLSLSTLKARMRLVSGRRDLEADASH